MSENRIEICVQPHNGGFLAFEPGFSADAVWGYSQGEAIGNYIIGKCKVINVPPAEGRDQEGWEEGNSSHVM